MNGCSWVTLSPNNFSRFLASAHAIANPNVFCIFTTPKAYKCSTWTFSTWGWGGNQQKTVGDYGIKTSRTLAVQGRGFWLSVMTCICHGFTAGGSSPFMPNINSRLWCLLKKADLVGTAAETWSLSFVVYLNDLFLATFEFPTPLFFLKDWWRLDFVEEKEFNFLNQGCQCFQWVPGMADFSCFWGRIL